MTRPPDGYHPLRLRVEQFDALILADLLPNHAELVDGELFEVCETGNPHSIGVTRSVYAFIGAWTSPRFFSVRGTHRFADHEIREPDLCLLDREPVKDALIDDLPRLVVEVSETTLAVDLGRKKRDYARFNVPEYWVLDVNGRRLYVHRDPVADAADAVSAWRDERIVPEDGTVSPLCVPDLTITVADLLGPA